MFSDLIINFDRLIVLINLALQLKKLIELWITCCSRIASTTTKLVQLAARSGFLGRAHAWCFAWARGRGWPWRHGMCSWSWRSFSASLFVSWWGQTQPQRLPQIKRKPHIAACFQASCSLARQCLPAMKHRGTYSLFCCPWRMSSHFIESQHCLVSTFHICHHQVFTVFFNVMFRYLC